MSRAPKKIIVSYQKRWSPDGTVYNQKLKIEKSFLRYINKLIRNYHESSHDVKDITAKTIGFSTYYDCYLTELDLKEKVNYLTITQLSFIYYYLSINNYDVSKIKVRNTIIETI